MELSGVAEVSQLVGIQVDPGRILEQAAVRVRDLGVQAMFGSRLPGFVERCEQAVQVIRARSARAANQLVDDCGESVLRDLAQVFGEQAPDRLQQEVAQILGRRCAPPFQLVIEIDDMHDCLTGELGLAAREHRLVAREKQ